MNKKTKIILIAVEAFVLLVLVLLGVGYQQKWIISTGDGPRFDWYAVGEDLNVDIEKIPLLPNKPSEPTEPDPTSENEPSATTRPSSVIPTPQPGEPEETTAPEDTTEPDIPEDTTEENRWGMGRF